MSFLSDWYDLNKSTELINLIFFFFSLSLKTKHYLELLRQVLRIPNNKK